MTCTRVRVRKVGYEYDHDMMIRMIDLQCMPAAPVWTKIISCAGYRYQFKYRQGKTLTITDFLRLRKLEFEKRYD